MANKTFILISVLTVIAAFLLGSEVARAKYGNSVVEQAIVPTTAPLPTSPPFTPTKTDKPEVKFFVMSFCPYGNQAEAGLEPVYQLLETKVTFLPRYVIYQDYCSGAPVDQKDSCEKNYCLASGGETYCSMHGLQELNQNIREICAFDQGDQDKWWKFVSLVNQNSTAQDIDTTWQAQAKTAGLDTAKISSCEKSQKVTILKKEVTENTKYQATGSPMIFINGVSYNGGRAPEDYKKAICSSFNNPPQECNQVLGQESAATSAGCN